MEHYRHQSLHYNMVVMILSTIQFTGADINRSPKPTLYCLPMSLSSHPSDPHPHFRPTQRLRLAAPLRCGRSTPGSSE
jgi:hypothetical protein